MSRKRIAGYLAGMGFGAFFGVVLSALMQAAKRGSEWEDV